MANNTFAAGSVNGVYPRPVAADSILDVLSHDVVSKASHINIFLANAFDVDGNYSHAMIGEIHEKDFRHVGSMSESNRGVGYLSFTVCRTFTFAPVFSVEANNIGALIGMLNNADVRGTLNIVYQSYPNGMKCYPEQEKAFKIIL